MNPRYDSATLRFHIFALGLSSCDTFCNEPWCSVECEHLIIPFSSPVCLKGSHSRLNLIFPRHRMQPIMVRPLLALPLPTLTLHPVFAFTMCLSFVFVVFFCLYSLGASPVKLLQTLSLVQFTIMTPSSQCTRLLHLVDSEHLQVKTVFVFVNPVSKAAPGQRQCSAAFKIHAIEA